MPQGMASSNRNSLGYNKSATCEGMDSPGFPDDASDAGSECGKEKPIEIKVISVRQPWAYFLLNSHPTLLQKWCECRSWSRATLYRGPLYIHASSWQPKPPQARGEFTQSEWNSLWEIPRDSDAPSSRIGHIIGGALLAYAANQNDTIEAYHVHGKLSSRKLTPQQAGLLPFLPPLDDTDASDNVWKWWDNQGVMILKQPRILVDPIPTGGRLNLWSFPVDPRRLIFQ